jgi:hypothetical protein
MEYTTRLPAVHLGGEAMTALETTLRSDCTAPEMEVTLEYGSVTYRYSSLEEIRGDVALPAVVRSFEVSLTAREGRIELVADDREHELNLQLSGDRRWVESKRRSIESFFEVHGARLRTFLEQYLAFCLGFAAVGLGLLAYYTGLGEPIGMRSPLDSILFASLALIGGGVLHLVLNRVYPYAVLVPSSHGTRASDALVYLRR